MSFKYEKNLKLAESIIREMAVGGEIKWINILDPDVVEFGTTARLDDNALSENEARLRKAIGCPIAKDGILILMDKFGVRDVQTTIMGSFKVYLDKGLKAPEASQTPKCQKLDMGE